MDWLSIEPTALRRLREEWTTDATARRVHEECEAHGAVFARGGVSRREGRVAVLPLTGLMDQKESVWVRYFGGTSTEAFGREFDRLVADESVRAIVLDVDSPGGFVTGTPELAEKVYRGRGSKPIVALANPLAASAALFVASAADEFHVTPTGDVGSLGVRSGHLDVSKALEDFGVVETMIVAKDSPHKAEFWSGAPLSDEDRERLQSVVDAHMQVFVAAMARHRGVSVEHVKEKFGGGRLLLPKEAKAVGLVDGIGTFDEVVGRVSRAAGRRSTKAARMRLDLSKRG